MKNLIQIPVFIIAIQWCHEVKCKPHSGHKHLVKTFRFGIIPLPPKHVSLLFETITPFGTFALEHKINKRQVAEAEVPPVQNELQSECCSVASKESLEIVETSEVDKSKIIETNSAPEVIITSVVEPIESGKEVSFVLPVDSEVVITPAKKEVVDTVSGETSEKVETETLIEEVVPPPDPVVEITPKPVEIPPLPEPQSAAPNVVLSTPIESTVPSVVRIPIFQNANTPFISPVNKIPSPPFLYTNINQIPFYTPSNFIPFMTPAAVPIPGVIVSPSAPPPVKESPSVVKEETPNFFVKGSRFVLQFGTMMLQMLSQFVNGRANFNQIPVTAPFPGVQ